MSRKPLLMNWRRSAWNDSGRLQKVIWSQQLSRRRFLLSWLRETNLLARKRSKSVASIGQSATSAQKCANTTIRPKNASSSRNVSTQTSVYSSTLTLLANLVTPALVSTAPSSMERTTNQCSWNNSWWWTSILWWEPTPKCFLACRTQWAAKSL